MGTLSKFLGEPKEVEIMGEKITLQPLKVKDIKLFSGASKEPTPEESEKMSKEIIKLSIVGADENEIDNLPMEVFMQIMDEINKLNGFKDERVELIKRKIAQAKGN